MKITVSRLSGKEIEISSKTDISELDSIKFEDLFWVDVEDFNQEFLNYIEKRFSIDPLTVEDINSGKQRVKTEDYPGYTFLVSKNVVKAGENSFSYDTEEIFLILMENGILTLHKKPSTIVKHSMDSIDNRAKRVKNIKNFPSLVMHQIFDFSVDSFFSALSDMENWLVSVRVDLLDFNNITSKELNDLKNIMSFISRARSEMGNLRITLTQHRDVMSLAQNDAIKFLSPDLSSDFRDVYDHTFQMIEALDSYTLRAGDIRDLYFTLKSAFTDNVLRLLTIVATIFLPLTFLTGFYGMNFTPGFFQPGTTSIYGFYLMVIAMVLISVILLAIFRKRGWV